VDSRIVDLLEDILESSIVFLQDSADISASPIVGVTKVVEGLTSWLT
jgi:hypothetical protein